jgi:hypothetical protein
VRRADAAGRGQRADPGELLVEADDEAHAPHLARRDDVDAGALLIEEGALGGVLDQLGDVDGTEATRLEGLARGEYTLQLKVAQDGSTSDERMPFRILVPGPGPAGGAVRAAR